MRKTCVNCEHFEKTAENAGYCRKYHWIVYMSLAKKDKVCEGMDEEIKGK
jgi:hypothetical protein